ncbi:MAG: hypothetical protein EB084_05780 [Proteobacteria bacterium]|nr:hypothetical protein [Pseudomonadota bacterium]
MRGFFYIINAIDENYELTGTAPDVSAGLITLGTEKPQIRAKVEPGDYVIGISRSFPNQPRRVIYGMRVGEIISFKEAWERGQTDPTFAAHRGGTANPAGEQRAMHAEEGPIIGGDIHVRFGKKGYEHISRAVHAFTWRKDLEGERDRYVVGDSTSRFWGAKGPVITDEIACLLGGKDYTAQYPLGEGCSYRVLNSAPALRKFLEAIGFFTPEGGARRVVRVIRKTEG